LIAVSFALAPAPAALAQRSDEPVAPKPFGWLDFGGAFYANGQWNSQQRTTGDNKIDEQQTLLREGVQVHTRGFAYHPNLLDWRLFADVAATQESLSNTGQTENTRGTLTSYDLSGILLREKFLSADFAASRSDDLRDRDFGQSVRDTRDRYAGGLSTKGKFPASVQVEHSARTQQGDVRSTEATTDKTRFRISDRRDVNWLTDLTLEREDTRETSTYQPFGGGEPFTEQLPVKRDELNLTNVYRFGPGADKHSLNGRVRYLDRTGTYMDKLLTAEETLELHHSKTFSTFYSASYLTEQTRGQTQDGVAASAGLNKKFYESLNVGIQGNYRDTKYADGFDKYARIGGALDYQKKTPIGLFTSSLQASRETEDQAQSSGLFNVRNEQVTLTGTKYEKLQRPNIVPGSIQVTDANDVIVYDPNEYILQPDGAFTKIARNADSTSIESGQLLHVSYAVHVARQSTVATDRIDWFNRLSIKNTPIDVYFRYRTRKDTLTGGEDPNNLEDEKTTVFGAEFYKYGFRLTAEHERDDRVLSPPSTINLLRASYDRPLGRDFNLHLDAHYRKTQYSQADRFGLTPGQENLDDLGANAQLTARISRNMLLRLLTEYAEYKGRENHSMFRNSVALEWRQGKLTFTLNARHETFTQEESSGQASAVTFNLKREF
jgi:opacity protein-like surface antigen